MKNKHVIIIAEAGVNHNGILSNAFKLVDAAVDAGVDFIKFQTYNTDNLVSDSAAKADYQIKNTNDADESQYEMLQRLELSRDSHSKLIAYCKERRISFFSTAFDLESLDYLSEIGLELVKIPSGEITNLPYLRKAAMLFKEVIVSTGMATIDEISSAIKVFEDNGIPKNKITILHCNTEYPTPMSDVNLTAMSHLQREFGTSVGYSDHTLGIEVPIAAVALGAAVIEKHFTLDKTLPGPDHKASLEPSELKAMVTAIRNIEVAVSGSGFKHPTPSELKNIAVARKSIVAIRDIKIGEYFTEENVTVKRPGNGISPMRWDEVIGSRSKFDFSRNDLIVLD